MADCLFCKIAAGEIESEKVYEDDKVVVFKDIHPKAPIHLLIVPREHIESVNDLTSKNAAVIGEMSLAAKQVAADHGLDEKGYKLVFNVGRGGGQMIDHLHLHLIGGWNKAPKEI